MRNNNIQLHELLVRLLPNTSVRVEKDSVIILEGEVGNLDDLKGYHHNRVSDISLNMLSTMIITLEAEPEE